ncbi:hypothetical protein [Lactiplantibacillus plantarum]|uniref:hypothetical protein n=1 Tax=Lactiplantibacillus plantarum TaxID=1590 RepID=UPI00117A7E3F|nr:hypothetical protein [Lactiplantibacillus plantarum]
MNKYHIKLVHEDPVDGLKIEMKCDSPMDLIDILKELPENVDTDGFKMISVSKIGDGDDD